MKTLIPTLVTLLLVQDASFAVDDTNILAAGDWSTPVTGSEDISTGRGAHHPVLRGRLLLCESPKNDSPAIYLELQDCGDVWGKADVFCNLNPGGGCHLENLDSSGKRIPPRMGGFGGGAPSAEWFDLPADATMRLRISAYVTFTYASTNDYFVSGTFVSNPPPDPKDNRLDVWMGTIQLPAMKVVFQTSHNQTATDFPTDSTGMTSDPIDGLVRRLSSSYGLWQNGLFKPIDLPASAPAEAVVAQVYKNANLYQGGKATNYQIIKRRQVQIGDNVKGNNYIAVLVDTNVGGKVVLLQYDEQSKQWWNRVYDTTP